MTLQNLWVLHYETLICIHIPSLTDALIDFTEYVNTSINFIVATTLWIRFYTLLLPIFAPALLDGGLATQNRYLLRKALNRRQWIFNGLICAFGVMLQFSSNLVGARCLNNVENGFLLRENKRLNFGNRNGAVSYKLVVAGAFRDKLKCQSTKIIWLCTCTLSVHVKICT